jgi:hypothetical protein
VAAREAWAAAAPALKPEYLVFVDELHDALRTVMDAITPDDARGYFLHCGYAPR